MCHLDDSCWSKILAKLLTRRFRHTPLFYDGADDCLSVFLYSGGLLCPSGRNRSLIRESRQLNARQWKQQQLCLQSKICYATYRFRYVVTTAGSSIMNKLMSSASYAFILRSLRAAALAHVTGKISTIRDFRDCWTDSSPVSKGLKDSHIESWFP